MINGCWNVFGGWIVWKPLVGYSRIDGEFLSIEWQGYAADVIAKRRNYALVVGA